MPPEDRRVRRSRRALRDALVGLALERGYANVTVEDITARADLGRATFYTHYTDKDDLLSHVVTDLLDELEARLRPLADVSDVGFTGKPVLEMFRHALEERDAYRVILRGEGDGRALRRFDDDRSAAVAAAFAARAENLGVTPRIDIDVVARAWVGEQTALLRWWLESDPPPVPLDEIADMLRNLSLHGRYWAIGFEGEPPA
ncbi:TetR/AcrR family transcriptional regulator [Nocardia acidivorans]|uniref:TetR/AcrR family transcriptional regulator n=1 Tax=Nocardia acidivorans TaxID=404580 RepID=UPI0008307227|nr:TetR/AcrR family transcriptional regulator [Nocardia acidivorans]